MDQVLSARMREWQHGLGLEGSSKRALQPLYMCEPAKDPVFCNVQEDGQKPENFQE